MDNFKKYKYEKIEGLDSSFIIDSEDVYFDNENTPLLSNNKSNIFNMIVSRFSYFVEKLKEITMTKDKNE